MGDAESILVLFDKVLGEIGEVVGSLAACVLLVGLLLLLRVVIVRLFVSLDGDALSGETIPSPGILWCEAVSSRSGSNLEIGALLVDSTKGCGQGYWVSIHTAISTTGWLDSDAGAALGRHLWSRLEADLQLSCTLSLLHC